MIGPETAHSTLRTIKLTIIIYYTTFKEQKIKCT